MASHHLPNYLRTHRLRLGLSQAELAIIFGYCESAISKYELRDVPRSVRLLVVSHITFGLSPEEIFPALYHEARAILREGAATLDAQLAAKRPDGCTSEKRKWIAELAARAKAKVHHL